MVKFRLIIIPILNSHATLLVLAMNIPTVKSYAVPSVLPTQTPPMIMLSRLSAINNLVGYEHCRTMCR